MMDRFLEDEQNDDEQKTVIVNWVLNLPLFVIRVIMAMG